MAGHTKLPFKRNTNSKTCLYTLLLIPPNLALAQFPNDGHSSLMKIPRYSTFGSPSVYIPGLIYTFSCWITGTSAHQYQGETPICLESS